MCALRMSHGVSLLREKVAAVSHCKSSSILGPLGSVMSPLLISGQVVYDALRPARLLVLRNRGQSCATSVHSRNECCRVSLRACGQSWQELSKPSRSLQAPTGSPSVRISHCMAETFLGRYGCQILLKNLARVLLLYPVVSSSTSSGIQWLFCLMATLYPLFVE